MDPLVVGRLRAFLALLQATNKADNVADLAQRVLEFRNTLLLDPALGRCGLNWKQVRQLSH